MDDSIRKYIRNQSGERPAVLSKMHEAILKNDTTVTATIGAMMAKEMILYKRNGIMKYGLAAVKNYLTLHVMPIYGSKELYDRYHALLPEAVFQKGCINFTGEQQFPLATLEKLITDCAPVNISELIKNARERTARKR